jgi:hypothetical protein
MALMHSRDYKHLEDLETIYAEHVIPYDTWTNSRLSVEVNRGVVLSLPNEDYAVLRPLRTVTTQTVNASDL